MNQKDIKVGGLYRVVSDQAISCGAFNGVAQHGDIIRVLSLDGSAGNFRFAAHPRQGGECWGCIQAHMVEPVEQPADKINPTSSDTEDAKGTDMSILNSAKRLALRLTNPDEAAMRRSKIKDDEGDLTEDGKEIVLNWLANNDEALKAYLADTAKQINAETDKAK